MSDVANRRHFIRLQRRRGATAVLVAIVLPILILLSAFAINLAYMELNRTELYVASDAAARAGGRDFALNGSRTSAKATARSVAAQNLVAGSPLQLSDADFVFGQSTRAGLASRYVFHPGGPNQNSVRITGRRKTGSLDGPIPFLMPNLLGTGQFNVELSSESTQIEVDIALVLDRSGSMAYAADEPAVYPPVPAAAPPGWMFCDAAPNPSRWRDVVAAVNVFVNELSVSPADERVALCTYSTDSTVDQALTGTYSSILVGMNAYTNGFCSGYTDIGGGIDRGVIALGSGAARPWAAKVIIVMTDGIQTAPGGGRDPDDAAEDAAEQKVMIFAVTFSDEADQSEMEEVAEIGLGRHYHANNASDLSGVFRDIVRHLPILLTR